MEYIFLLVIAAFIGFTIASFGLQNIAHMLTVGGIAAILIPVLYIYCVGVYQMNAAPAENVTAIASTTITSIMDYFIKHILEAILIDILGMFIGVIAKFAIIK